MHVHAGAVFGTGMAHDRRGCGHYAGHAGMIHAGHRGMAAAVIRVRHRAHHVLHAQPQALVQRRHLGFHAGARRQRAARVAAAVDRLGEHGVRARLLRLDDHVVGFGRRDAEFVHRHRLHVLAVGGDHRHLQAGNAHVEDAGRRTVDEAQPDLLAGPEDAGPVARRRRAVHQVGVGVAGDVAQVGRVHAHLAPHPAHGQRLAQALLAHIAKEIRHGRLGEVVVVALLFQPGVDARGILVGPVVEHHHVVAVGRVALGSGRLDHQRAVQRVLFLEARMRVIPVGAALAQLEPVEKAFARRDAVETEAGHAIHPERQDDAVPVDRGGHAQAVGHAQVHRGALLPAQQRAGHAAVDGGRGPRHPGEVDGGLDDVQRKIGAAERGGLAGAGQRPGIRGT